MVCNVKEVLDFPKISSFKIATGICDMNDRGTLIPD